MIYCMRTRIFFSVNNKDYLLVPNFRIIEFCLHTEYRGRSRIFFSFFSCPELSNYRIFVFTRNITDSHGFSFLIFLSRIIELSNFIFFVPRLVFCPELSDYRIFVFRDSPWFPVWLKINSLIRKFVTKIIPWYSAILRVTKRNNSQIRKFVTKIIPCEKPPVMHY